MPRRPKLLNASVWNIWHFAELPVCNYLFKVFDDRIQKGGPLNKSALFNLNGVRISLLRQWSKDLSKFLQVFAKAWLTVTDFNEVCEQKLDGCLTESCSQKWRIRGGSEWERNRGREKINRFKVNLEIVRVCVCVCVCVCLCAHTPYACSGECVRVCMCVTEWKRVGARGESDDMQIFTLGVSAELHGLPFH